MKKALIGVAAVIVVIVCYLVAFSFASDAHVTARTAIERTADIAASIGRVKTVVLIGVRQKLVPGGLSCTSASYIVFGSAGVKAVTVDLSLQGYSGVWKVDAVSGWFGSSAQSC
jgi:hypothetical protein